MPIPWAEARHGQSSAWSKQNRAHHYCSAAGVLKSEGGGNYMRMRCSLASSARGPRFFPPCFLAKMLFTLKPSSPTAQPACGRGCSSPGAVCAVCTADVPHANAAAAAASAAGGCSHRGLHRQLILPLRARAAAVSLIRLWTEARQERPDGSERTRPRRGRLKPLLLAMDASAKERAAIGVPEGS